MKCTLLSLLGLLLVAGCGVEPGENLGRLNAIESGWITISADVDHAYVDRKIVVSTRCHPLLKGKGRIAIWGGGELRLEAKWVVEWPVQDTLVGQSDVPFPVEIPVSFEPNADFVQQWRVQLYPQGVDRGYAFYFEAHAMMDSVFLADSNRYFPIESPEVRRLTPRGDGYEPGALSTILKLAKP